MQYGSGVYDGHRNYAAPPVPRMRPEAYEIASKHIGSGMYACLNQPKATYTFGNQNKVNMDGGPMRNAGVRSTIPVDPVYNGGKYSNRSARPVPRVKPEASEVAEKSKGCMGILFGNYGKPDPAIVNNTREGDIDPRGSGPMKKAGIRGPILVDPIYKENYTGRTPRPAPRVKAEASEIANKSKGVVAKLFVEPERRYHERPKSVPHPGVRSSVFPQQSTPVKNHTSENVKRMRRIQRESKERQFDQQQQQQRTPVKALWKSSQYDNIESRVKPHMQEPPRAPRPGSAASQSSDVSNPRSSLTPRKPVNFVARNARAAKTHELRRSKSQMALNESLNNNRESLEGYKQNVRGKTPAYLQTRQKQWDEMERERIRNQPDPSVPEGHTVLPDQERKETLSTLKKSQEELLEQHRLLPIRSADSIGVRNRKSELERRIMEVDEAIQVFQRPRVFVRLDQ